MAFHEYGGTDSGDVLISLPQWVLEIGKDNQDIFFTDREGRRNTECLSWGIDKERVLKGRTGIEVYITKFPCSHQHLFFFSWCFLLASITLLSLYFSYSSCHCCCLSLKIVIIKCRLLVIEPNVVLSTLP